MKTTRISLFGIAILFALAASPTSAQVARAAAAPKVDGSFAEGEYALVQSHSGMRLGAALSPDGKSLHLALAAPTAGWVALGLGSTRMDGAHIVMGFDDRGKPRVVEQLGVGHGHRDAPGSKLLRSAVREEGGETVLELELPAADFVPGAALKLIMAYGRADNFVSMHARIARAELAVAR